MRRDWLWGVLLALLVVRPVSAVGAQGSNAQREDYFRSVGEYFHVMVDEVRIISEWEVAEEDIPVVFFLARWAGISADAAAAERSRGISWLAALRQYDVPITRLYVAFAPEDPLGPLASLYQRMADTRRGDWDSLNLTDREITILVNVQMLSSTLRVLPTRVLEAAQSPAGFLGVQSALAIR